MSRLIDADEFKKQVAGMAIINNFPADKANALCNLIDKQTTAYDVDKVAEKLEEVKNKDTEIALDEAQKERCFWYAQGMNRAIEIVKGGGVDE